MMNLFRGRLEERRDPQHPQPPPPPFSSEAVNEASDEVAVVETIDDDDCSSSNNNPQHRLRRHPLDVASSLRSLAALYAMILVSVYISFTFTELVTFPRLQLYLEKHGFFIYLYAVADIFLAYVIFFTVWKHGCGGSGDKLWMVENHKSHGSLPIRLGALIFGIGTLIYFLLEFLNFTEIKEDPRCYFKLLGANIGLSIVFVTLQTFLIFMYPRLNLHLRPGLDSFGTMHLVATNIILWIRTLVKESLLEIVESEEEEHEEAVKVQHPRNCNSFSERLMEFEHHQEACMRHGDDILGDVVLNSSPYLYPFVIEYALIGASVVFLMWAHVGKLPHTVEKLETSVINRPHPRQFIRKGDWSHTRKGMMAGFVVFSLAVLNLGLFFGLDGGPDGAEFYSKLVNTITNLLGILALILGFGHIQLLGNKDVDRPDETQMPSDQLDLTLLKFTAFFSYLYLNFSIISGSFSSEIQQFTHALLMVNGIMDMTQISLQLMFLTALKRKEQVKRKPGRQVTVFLFLFNLSQWIVVTFEIQKVKASLVEANFFGFMPWVVIQRVTLPLMVFFRFHSAVVSIEMWKEIYWNH